MPTRYAIYYAPAPDTALWRFGSDVLGYDAATGEDVPQWVPEGFTPQAWAAATADPRKYGFHATLKAPFALAAPYGEDALLAALERFAAGRTAVDLGPCGVHEIASSQGGGFLALTPVEAPSALAALERAILEGFEPFRAPLTPEDRARRNPERLSPRQRDYLDTWGYPLVLEEFRFHMSLTGRIEDTAPAAARLQARAEAAGAAGPVRLDRLALFRQEDGQRFRVLATAWLR
ncbi:DUF1045 domain-containing protein [Labrys wisconsinensis]|uniref:Phosphonate metabolism protein n=1 Tax=Labrys wisconsinensis TaxID=425677 RepID=A0ABU0J8P3_9HYPH|nr:DUF1045 domain-containing protein [Labrys wisconsinensis]MDQ0470650.1 hypothetical protein [Labrys wisconsinensis]